jgi:hypothetical protein
MDDLIKQAAIAAKAGDIVIARKLFKRNVREQGVQ